jgi:ferredoxin
MCAVVCPHRIFEMRDKKAEILDLNGCMECGACAKNCPVDAISVEEGVGCASAIIYSWLTGNPPSCDCSGSSCC